MEQHFLITGSHYTNEYTYQVEMLTLLDISMESL
jgi:hypothetical protein